MVSKESWGTTVYSGEEEEDELLVPEPDAEELAEDRIRGSGFELIVSVLVIKSFLLGIMCILYI
jgi:hypothetical protein